MFQSISKLLASVVAHVSGGELATFPLWTVHARREPFSRPHRLRKDNL